MNVELLELFRIAATGLVAGLFASALSNRDHRHRKWWEMRVEAYRAVIESLSDLVYFYDHKYSATIERRNFPSTLEEQLASFFNQAYARIRKAADSGAFLFSDPANSALSNFLIEDQYYCYEDHLETHLIEAKKCLNILVACSRKDLQLKNR